MAPKKIRVRVKSISLETKGHLRAVSSDEFKELEKKLPKAKLVVRRKIGDGVYTTE